MSDYLKRLEAHLEDLEEKAAPPEWESKDGAHYLDVDYALISVRSRAIGEYYIEIQSGELWTDLVTESSFTFSGDLESAKAAAVRGGIEFFEQRIGQLQGCLNKLRKVSR